MTLLEALVALVILGLSGVAALGALNSAAGASRGAAEWVEAVARAETAMEAASLAPAPPVDAGAEAQVDGPPPEVASRPWEGGFGLEHVSVTVRLPDGGSFTLERLVRVP